VYWNRIPGHRMPQYIQMPSVMTLKGQYITTVNLSTQHSFLKYRSPGSETRRRTRDEMWQNLSRALGHQ
jgi:hypothetical protein